MSFPSLNSHLKVTTRIVLVLNIDTGNETFKKWLLIETSRTLLFFVNPKTEGPNIEHNNRCAYVRTFENVRTFEIDEQPELVLKVMQ